MISIIVAASENNVMGNKGQIPWRLSDDLKRFAALTKNHTVIMGRKTFESIKGRLGKPLPNRLNVVVTRQKNYSAQGCEVASSLEEALRRFAKDKNEVFIIGGAEIYKEALPKTDRIYKTTIHAKIQGDAFFPDTDESEWQTTRSEFHPKDNKNEHDATYAIYERRVKLNK
ncbi:MAG: Dihydrofolate reductase FolA [Parcubacteria group bacterium GW2011_GWA2_47_21]|nr:MAG: Dihydrofolate reductase FolA [Parcubacteria group bacterium GW2011_GWA2_47_21]